MKPFKIIIIVYLVFFVSISLGAQPTDYIAYYPFNGDVRDVKGGNDATNEGAVPCMDRDGKINSALYFNGSAVVYLPTLFGSNSFTISFWMKPSRVDYGGVLQIKVPYDFNFYIYNWYLGYDNPDGGTGGPINNPNEWIHVVLNYGNDEYYLYENGINVGGYSSSVTWPVNTIGVNKIGLVDNWCCDNEYYTGCIDEMKIFNRYLTDEEVNDLYTSTLAQNIGYTYFPDGSRKTRNLIPFPTTKARKTNAKIKKETFEDNLGDQKIIIYPNPTRGQLKVEIQGFENETNSALYLFDLNGKLILTKKPVTSSMDLDLSDYSIGNYVMKIVIGNKKSEWKIVKE